jgi:hypothetical protein
MQEVVGEFQVLPHLEKAIKSYIPAWLWQDRRRHPYRVVLLVVKICAVTAHVPNQHPHTSTMPITQTIGSQTLQGFLVEASSMFSSDIYRRTVDTSVWLKLIQQEAWPEGMGDTISVLTYERTLPRSNNSWNTISVDAASSASTGSPYVPSASVIDVAQTIRTYGIQHTAVESQNILMHDALFSFRMQEQLRAVYDNLVDNVAYLWQKRYRDEYRRLCGHKVVAARNSALQLWDTSGDDYPVNVDSANFGSATTGVSTLTQGLLNLIYLQLIREGGGNKPMGRENGRPIFTLVCSPEISDALIRLNAATRDDFRYSPQVSELLKPLGVERSYRGFYHLIDVQIPRYNYVPGSAGITALTVTGWDPVSRTGTVNITASTVGLANIVLGQRFSCQSATAGNVVNGTVIAKSAATGTTGSFTFFADSAQTSGTGSFSFTTLGRNFSGTITEGFTEVPFYIPDVSHTPGPFVPSAAPAGGQGGSTAKRWIVNPAYETAQFEEAFVLHPEVMKSLIPRPLSSPGGNTKFEPISYRGDFRFLNIPDRVLNPDGNYGYFRGVLASGSKPCRPEFGYAIMFQRQPVTGVYHLPTSDLVAASGALIDTLGAAITGEAQD